MLRFSGHNLLVNLDILKFCVVHFINMISINNSICINLKVVYGIGVVYGKSEYVKTRYMFSEIIEQGFGNNICEVFDNNSQPSLIL